ncbi:probable RLM1-transcription factor of the MADS box family [Fusarium mangiferae]|uniref:MADS-box MEF2 type transcription factor MIG1 n=1 Tax=Fusarium mangiferae TaxID=192010 RepID=A0A1L7TGZ4_FUSMA|nr:putative RLM1-transcription factor of the MADS box family [Fusarium mangiferae]CVK94046.1 probable RLM1-transcription factor of the MADS box family [Fusarium mangiferae]
MGRRKIEIKAIKDDRNRSVTFLKRKGGLFKKAHELSVLCSVDVAVFIFGNNKKLYEYSSTDMRELIHRYQYHGGPSEHKGPSDFNGGNDDDEDEENDGTPPHGPEVVENQMMPPHAYGQHQPPFPQIRHHTPSASPPIGNGGPFQAHPGHPIQRQHTPQPSIGSRPASRTDMRRMGPSMVQPPPPPGPPHPGMNYMPNPPIYNSPHPPGLIPQHGPGPHPQYAYHQQPSHMQQPGPYMDDRRSPMPSPMPPAYTSQPPSQPIQAPVRPTPSPQPPQQQLPPNMSQMSPPPPQPERRLHDPPPPPPVEPKTEPQERPQPPLLNTDSAIKKLPQRKSHSIFTPIEENRSILSQHLASFTSESNKSESAAAAAAANAANAANRSQSVDVAALNRAADGPKSSPHLPQRASTQTDEKSRTVSLSSIPETTLTPPSRSNSAKAGGPGGARPRGPRLTVQIPDGGSEGGGSARTAESNSPRVATETTTQAPQRHNSQSSLVLPPPSPSASAILSAGATGPPNPFARPPPQQNVNGDTPVSALPSRFLTNELLPSPSSFYPDWNFRGGDSNTLPSPLNFATPVVGSGPSFLRDDLNTTPNANSNASKDRDPLPGANGSLGQNLSVAPNNSTATKRKTPEPGAITQSDTADESEPKRLKVDE